MFELKHIPLDKSVSDFLIGPCDEEFVIMVGLVKKFFFLKQEKTK